uniref:Uncharacterized protein n=1 Tax=Vombatus ursinus TaxID=29139 RepID=A0A4X2MFL1_VOMUR
GVHPIHTGAITLTAEAPIASRAGTGEGRHMVGAGPWATRTALTLIDVHGTSKTHKARETGTGERAHAVPARATIQTRVWGDGWYRAHRMGPLAPFLPQLLEH